jgi:hypothetical protein
MADYSDYYSVIARAISGLPSKTDEARHAIYERARTALQKRFDPPISETDLAIERFALEAAIQRVETESRFGDTRHGLSFISMVKQFVRSVRDKFNNNIAIRGDSLKAAITAGLAQGLGFIQRTQLTALGRHFFNIFGGPRWITKYPQIRITVRLIVAALVGIFVAIFFHWMTAENIRESKNSRESKSYSLISPSELALRDVTLSQPLSVSLGAWEIKGVVKNNSPRTLTGLWLKVTVRDCPNASLCATIGEAIRHVVINVPPSQTRIIDEGDLFPREMFIPEKLQWSYQIVQAIVQAD